MIIGVRRWFMGITLLGVVAAFFGGMIGRWRPGVEPPCEDTVSTINKSVSCDHRARMALDTSTVFVLVKCICKP